MRLRTQFALLLSISVGIAGLALYVSAVEVSSALRHSAAAGQAQLAQTEARGLLTLTFELALYGQPRAAEQWPIRFESLTEDLARARSAVPHTHTDELEGALLALPDQFERLEQARRAAQLDPASITRVELLTANLIADTQGILESVSQWVGELEAQRATSERRLALAATAAPLLLLLVLLGAGRTVFSRVTGPIRRLQAAMAEVTAGNLAARSTGGGADEIGDLARDFDAMTASLQIALRQRVESERQLRLITDHLPARVARLDAEQRFVFANKEVCRAFAVASESELLGRTLREVRGEDAYRPLEPRLRAVLQGQAQTFVMAETSDDGGAESSRWLDVSLVADRNDEGAVQGCYAMLLDITETMRNRQRIDAALAEKEVLLSEIHHRVKNNMQVITSLLALQVGQTQDAALRNMLDECCDRIRSMALIHEKLYQSADFSAVDFGDYARTLVQMISRTQGHPGIVAEVQAEAVQLDLDQAVPVGLLLNELVSNSFKHGFPGGRSGRIDICMASLAGGRVRLEVRDDGQGAPGLDLQQGSTLGLRLVRLLVGQLDAELKLHSEPGFTCTLEFAAHQRAR